MRRRRLRRRLLWVALGSALILLALAGYVLRAVEVVASAVRGVPTPEGSTR